MAGISSDKRKREGDGIFKAGWIQNIKNDSLATSMAFFAI